MIEVTNLTKKYGNHTAVDGLSFRLERGHIYGFLGPNGAGKSTTMNILTGYLAPSSGTVLVDGRDIQKEPEEAKRKIGYLPELPPLYMDMTVQEYLRFVAELKKVPAGERAKQMETVMEMTGIADMRGRLIKNLSKGYRQRVGLAQAVLGNPEVLILDEPSVGLDPKQIIEIRELICRLGETHTIILSSHILSEVDAVCDHIMIIAHGKLVASDSPEGLQKLMSGSNELELVVKGSEEAVLAVLEEVPEVEKVEVLQSQNAAERSESPSDKEEGTEAKSAQTQSVGPAADYVRVRILSANHADIREDVFYALAQSRLPILEMHYREKSLEDIFLELTGEEDKVNVGNL